MPITFKGPNGKQLIGAGQKSGWFYALDPKDGSLVWKTEVGPGGKLGGIEFGGATDGERVYVGISAIPNIKDPGRSPRSMAPRARFCGRPSTPTEARSLAR